MFDPDFYPTPKSVAVRMLAPYMSRRITASGKPIRSILEPSAGKGDILDVFTGVHEDGFRPNYYGPKIQAIEQSPELVAILRSKGYRVVASDFLSYIPEVPPDLIVMNPPFSNGDEHLLHAWEILKGGDIVCLLNAETTRNPYSERRKLLARIIADHGSVAYIGQVFKGAERSTDVDVCIVRLSKEAEKSSDFDWDFSEGEKEQDPLDLGAVGGGQGLMAPDQIGAYIRCYEKTKEAYKDYLKARAALNFYAHPVLKAFSTSATSLADESLGRRGADGDEAAYASFVESLRLQFWTAILGKMGIEKLLTHDLRQKFAQFIEEQGAMALTKENISNIASTMLMNADNILKQSVVAVFDMFTKYHSENRVHVEGWKTNEQWMAGKKVILPFYVRFEYGRFGAAYGKSSEYSDIDKAMCYLSGKRLEDIVGIHDAIKPNENVSESTFFKMRYFKKGTMHLEFKDTALWAKFNQVACDGKNWLGNK